MAVNVEIRGLSKTFAGSDNRSDYRALDCLDLQVRRGEFVSLLGPSGSGKSTLLRILAGLDQDYQGEILLDGASVTGRDPRVGMVFQEFALFPWRTTLENIEAGLEFAGVPKKERRRAAMEYIAAFGLSGFESCLPKELSGGMKQRVAIARTLINNPQLVLMDEPFGALDCQMRNALHAFLIKLWLVRRDTILFVTHNVDEAVFLSDRIVVFSPSPARVLRTFDIDMPHPRDRTSFEFNQMRRTILELLASSSDPLSEKPGRHVTNTQQARHEAA
ncbi:ABC transporter ATP-binding protein [Geomonas subterranea]|uniref:ABC transporter ATP-binding protein n=1 Tax=Geomonas subterranea TaxID=2847989 RepID=A0ABX8LKT5_9BACT|nr:ABC transporter ATP-binding protein [Geomonas subterranea]QXE92645.1 ABC transporter ATP-binding protein [Geomonas subterranea]QXM09256.1 ABC transporter ATP-binding protein [Geomonas subterranea]